MQLEKLLELALSATYQNIVDIENLLEKIFDEMNFIINDAININKTILRDYEDALKDSYEKGYDKGYEDGEEASKYNV